MSSQAFLWINAVLAVAILSLFAIRRGQRQPTRLRLRNGSRLKYDIDKAATMDPETLRAQAMGRREKSLNVLFNYNGHSWDAFEVLGLPAGAPAPLVDEAYKREKARLEKSRHEFLDCAYSAIQSHRRSS